MSRSLPERPSLDHLRMQAKDLLGELQKHNPDAQLSDALHALARDYGFPTWPKLKEHVESMPRAANPLAGRWVANLGESRRHPDNPFRSATIEFAVEGNVVTIADTFVDESGASLRNRNTIRADGKPHPLASGYVMIADWRGPSVLETEVTIGGKVEGTGKYEVSADGARLTITSPGQCIVLDRA